MSGTSGDERRTERAIAVSLCISAACALGLAVGLRPRRPGPARGDCCSASPWPAWAGPGGMGQASPAGRPVRPAAPPHSTRSNLDPQPVSRLVDESTGLAASTAD